MIVYFRERHAPGIDRFSQLGAEEVRHGLLLIEPSRRGFLCRVGSAPVGDHEAFEAPITLEHIAQGVGILATVVFVDPVIGAHDRAGIGDGDGNMERQQIRLLHAPFGDDGIDEVATGFLVVHRVMLDVTDHVLGLFTLHQVADDRSGEERVFPGVLEGAAVTGLTGEVHSAAESHVEALRAKLAANQRAVRAGGVRVPTRRGSQA